MVERENPVTSADEAFAKNLRWYRERLGISQAQLAQRMMAVGFPYHQQTIAKIENNTRPVRLGEAETLANIVGATFSEMISEGQAEREAQERYYSAKLHLMSAEKDALVLRDREKEIRQRVSEAEENLFSARVAFEEVAARLDEVMRRNGPR